ncbi:MAG: ComF family protein [Dehalococcoidia bacterium]|nr:ComF family protein [Dehalococcoidia bacterium]
MTLSIASILARTAVTSGAARLASATVDLLFPKRCVGCDREGAFLCQKCLAELPRVEPPFCFLCGQPGRLMMRLCPSCWERPLEIDGIRAPYRMEGAIRQVVHGLKYQYVRALAPDLGHLLSEFIAGSNLPADVLVPVPLHPRRERSRGYNQSLLLARETGKVVGLPVDDKALRRIRATPSQARSSSQKERRANVANAFAAETSLAEGRRILLVDDVCTTGATPEACAIALKEAGATSVWGLTLAREV